MGDFFTLFMSIFMTIALGFCAIVILVSMRDAKAKKALKPTQYLSYKKGHFYRDFTFTCEACGTQISSIQERCPSCGGVYGANKEYVKKKRAMNFKYCYTEIRGKSTDEVGCPSCGASYKENLDLRVAEEEENVERMHYEEYMYLRDLEWEQNKRNEERDRRVDTKYAKPIAFMTNHGAGNALVMIGLMMLAAAGIACLILKLR